MKRKTKALLALLILLSLCIIVASRVNLVIDDYAKNVIKNTVYKEINTTIYEYIKNDKDNFHQAVKREYDGNGTLICLSLNSALINNIKTGLEKDILNTISKLESSPFYIRAGNLLGIKLLAEKGAKIKMMIAPLGTLSCDTINTFDSVGINHTLHRVGYEFNVSFKAAAPFHTSSFQVKFTILICETIIVGKVPSVYVN